MGYFAILGAVLAGYTAMPPWSVAVAAIALVSLSYAEHYRIYERAYDAGFDDEAGLTLLRSVGNGLLAATVAYGGGWIVAVM